MAEWPILHRRRPADWVFDLDQTARALPLHHCGLMHPHTLRSQRAMPAHYLEALFAPKSVAVVGASERTGALGNAVFTNLLAGGLRARTTR